MLANDLVLRPVPVPKQIFSMENFNFNTLGTLFYGQFLAFSYISSSGEAKQFNANGQTYVQTI